MIIWAGTSSEDVGMVIEHYPSIQLPQKQIDVQSVPGRNGDIILPTGAYSNYEQSYAAFLDSKYIGGLERVIPKISDWLLGHDGYQRLEDTYFPDVYRMAYYTGGAEFVSIFNEYGEGTLTFNCAPEKFLKQGEEPIVMTKNKVLTNLTAFTAFPLIKITGTGANGTLTFNNTAFNINTVPSSMTIDPKLHKAYNGSTNYSNLIKSDYDILKLGKQTTITWSGGISAVSITPRWWTI